jgi:hypothetical protein
MPPASARPASGPGRARADPRSPGGARRPPRPGPPLAQRGDGIEQGARRDPADRAPVREEADRPLVRPEDLGAAGPPAGDHLGVREAVGVPPAHAHHGEARRDGRHEPGGRAGPAAVVRDLDDVGPEPPARQRRRLAAGLHVPGEEERGVPVGDAQDQGSVVRAEPLAAPGDDLEADAGALPGPPGPERDRARPGRERGAHRLSALVAVAEDGVGRDLEGDRPEPERVVRVRVGDEDRGQPPHAEVPQERQDVPRPGVVGPVDRAAAVHQHGRAVREPQERGVPLAHREEGDLEPTAQPGGEPAGLGREEQAGGRRRGQQGAPPPGGPPGQEGERQGARGGSRTGRANPERAPGGRGGRVGEPDQDRREGVGDPQERGREGRREGAGGGRERGDHREGRAHRQSRHVGDHAEQGHLAEVEREHGGGGERGGRGGAGAREERLEQPGPPGPRRRAGDGEGAPDGAGPEGEPRHRREGELERRVEQGAGLGCEERQRGQGERVDRVGLPVEQDAGEGGQGRDRRPEHRDLRPGGERVHDRHRDGRRRGEAPRVPAPRHRLHADEEGAQQPLEPEGDHHQVEPGDGEHVREPAPGEGERGGRIERAAVAGPDGADHAALPRRQHLGRLGEAGPPPLERRERARRRDPDGRERRDGPERDAPRREVQGGVPPAGVPRARRRLDAGDDPDPVPERERPGHRGREDLDPPPVPGSEDEAHPVARRYRDGRHGPLDRGNAFRGTFRRRPRRGRRGPSGHRESDRSRRRREGEEEQGREPGGKRRASESSAGPGGERDRRGEERPARGDYPHRVALPGEAGPTGFSSVILTETDARARVRRLSPRRGRPPPQGAPASVTGREMECPQRC